MDIESLRVNNPEQEAKRLMLAVQFMGVLKTAMPMPGAPAGKSIARTAVGEQLAQAGIRAPAAPKLPGKNRPVPIPGVTAGKGGMPVPYAKAMTSKPKTAAIEQIFRGLRGAGRYVADAAGRTAGQAEASVMGFREGMRGKNTFLNPDTGLYQAPGVMQRVKSLWTKPANRPGKWMSEKERLKDLVGKHRAATAAKATDAPVHEARLNAYRRGQDVAKGYSTPSALDEIQHNFLDSSGRLTAFSAAHGLQKSELLTSGAMRDALGRTSGYVSGASQAAAKHEKHKKMLTMAGIGAGAGLGGVALGRMMTRPEQ